MNVGDKVLCIDATIDPDKIQEIKSDFEMWLIKGQEYTIRDIVENNGIVPGLLLDEVYNFPKFFSLIQRTQEPAFATWRFEKLNYASSAEEVEEEVGLTVYEKLYDESKPHEIRRRKD